MKQTDLKSLLTLRKTLHQNPEVSGKEFETAKRINEFFNPIKPDQIIEKLGGQGLAFVFEGLEKGPVSLYRCELDGLPIQERNDIPHISTLPGSSHVCGHDGHMAIISGLGLELSRNRPQKGNVILLFQPAEETGEGATAILKDPKFQQIKPDFAFALHNLPGYELNQVIIKKGAFTASSVGMVVKLHGRTSHSAHPEAGNSPAEAMCKTIMALEKLPEAMKKFTLVTIGHARLGDVAFGTAPGEAVVMATLRSFDNKTLDKLVSYAEKLVSLIAKESGLTIEISYTESFAATDNDPDAWHLVNEVAKKLDLKTNHIRVPFRWSEDFGLFSNFTKTLLFGLGSGRKQPQLHEPNFDFPDEIIPTGIQLFMGIIEQIHGKSKISQS